MENYSIFPTESLLLGECLGEYLEYTNECQSTASFLDFVRRRLLPVIPTLENVGVIHGLDTIHEKKRKSLTELIVIELRDCLATSAFDEVVGIHPLYHRLHAWFEAKESWDESPSKPSAFDRRSRDDTKAIEVRLTSWVHSTGHVELFQLGLAFGKLIADCGQAVADLCTWLSPSDELSESLTEFCLTSYVSEERLSEIVKSEFVQNSGVTHELIDSIRSHLNLPYPCLGTEYSVNVNQAVTNARDALTALWCVFGEVLGSVRSIDVFAREMDASSITPRAFAEVITPESSFDQVHMALVNAERRLAESKETLLAESIIRDCGAAIEALARQLWIRPSGIFTDGLGSQLHHKLKSSKELERRFASIALTLYTCFRNPAQHRMDTFRCTIEEARFFVAGIRSLMSIVACLSNED